MVQAWTKRLSSSAIASVGRGAIQIRLKLGRVADARYGEVLALVDAEENDAAAGRVRGSDERPPASGVGRLAPRRLAQPREAPLREALRLKIRLPPVTN